MTLPLCRVFAGPVAFDLGGVEHVFYSSALAFRGFGNADPERLQHAKHGGGVDLVDGYIPYRLAVGREVAKPLAGVRFIAPVLLFRLVIFGRACAE